MNIARNALSASLAILILTALLGIAYPLAITGIAQVVFPDRADGQMIERDGTVVGSRQIGQSFHRVVTDEDGKPTTDEDGNVVTEPDERYFQSRPSATVPSHNPAATTFSNLGPNSVAAKDLIAANVDAYLKLESPYHDELTAKDVPVDAAHTSGSGIDPHISLANARIQAARIAKERGAPEREIRELIDQHTTGRSLGVFGEPGVNVLELNLALDKEYPQR